jgi:hypothetical protein
MSEDRSKLDKNDEIDGDEVEAHKLDATLDPEKSDDNDVEAHKLD